MPNSGCVLHLVATLVCLTPPKTQQHHPEWLGGHVAVGAERDAGEIAVRLSQASQVLVAQQAHVPRRDLGVLAELDLQFLW